MAQPSASAAAVPAAAAATAAAASASPAFDRSAWTFLPLVLDAVERAGAGAAPADVEKAVRACCLQAPRSHRTAHDGAPSHAQPAHGVPRSRTAETASQVAKLTSSLEQAHAQLNALPGIDLASEEQAARLAELTARLERRRCGRACVSSHRRRARARSDAPVRLCVQTSCDGGAGTSCDATPRFRCSSRRRPRATPTQWLSTTDGRTLGGTHAATSPALFLFFFCIAAPQRPRLRRPADHRGGGTGFLVQTNLRQHSE